MVYLGIPQGFGAKSLNPGYAALGTGMTLVTTTERCMIYSVLPTAYTTLPVPPQIAVIAINDSNT